MKVYLPSHVFIFVVFTIYFPCCLFTIEYCYYSVANTVKRAFLIWISVIIFSNPVTFLSGVGTIVVTIGVLLYTKAKEYDHNLLQIRQSYPRNVTDNSDIAKVV